MSQKRLFLGLNIPPTQKKVLSRAQSVFEPLIQAKLVEENNFHITLKFLGYVEENDISKIKEILSNTDFEKFFCELNGFGVFPKPSYPRVLWVGVKQGFDKITKLHYIIDEKLNTLGFPYDERFHPHVTLARIKKVLNKQVFMKEMNKQFLLEPFEINEFTLFESKLSPKGPKYIKLMSFGLK